MEKMYKVFKVDICFDSYATDIDFIGADSKQDLIDKLQEIYSYETVVQREDFDNEYDWLEECENGKYKDGDTKTIYRFTDEQMEKFRESLNYDDSNELDFGRITEIPHMFTDTPYEVLDGCAYYE